MATRGHSNQDGSGPSSKSRLNALNQLMLSVCYDSYFRPFDPQEGRGQEVVSGRGRAIVPARPGCCVALRRSPLSATISSLRPSVLRSAQDQVSGTDMPQKVRIALDAMGGDVGASVVIPGAAVSLARHPGTEFLLFGDSALIEAQLARHPAMKAASRVVHTDVTVSKIGRAHV